MRPKITESQWQAASSWNPIFYAVESRRYARKMRLFGCACCRRVWSLLTEPESRAAVEIAERFADGAAPKDALKAARKAGNEATRRAPPTGWWAASAAEMVAHATYQDSLSTTATRVGLAVEAMRVRSRAKEEAEQVKLLRDIFGNPFRPVSFSSEWRTDTTVAIARGMYDSRDFSGMPILADALQDAGCENEVILKHCRDRKQKHVRGCWVVDVVLGKE